MIDSRSIHNTVSLHSACIPLSYYIVNEENNEVIINGVTYTVTPGNYSAKNLCAAIQTLTSIVCTLSTITNKITFSFGIAFTLGAGTINYILGFESTTYTGTSITAPRCVNVGGPSRVNVYTNIEVMNITSAGTNSLLACIPISTIPTSFVVYTDQGTNENIFYNTNLQIIDVQLTDENDTPLLLNGVDWTIELRFNETLIIDTRGKM